MDTATIDRVKVMVTTADIDRFVPAQVRDRVDIVEVPDMGKNVDFVAVNDHVFSMAKEEEIRQYIRSFL